MNNANKIVPHPQGGFVVAGVLRVETAQEAVDMFESTVAVKAKDWPFLDRRREPRLEVVEHFGRCPADYHVTVRFL